MKAVSYLVAGISEGVAVAPPSRFTADGNADRIRDFEKRGQWVAKLAYFREKSRVLQNTAK